MDFDADFETVRAIGLRHGTLLAYDNSITHPCVGGCLGPQGNRLPIRLHLPAWMHLHAIQELAWIRGNDRLTRPQFTGKLQSSQLQLVVLGIGYSMCRCSLTVLVCSSFDADILLQQKQIHSLTV